MSGTKPLTPEPAEARIIRTARAWAGMSRKQVADALGMSEETIGRYERGTTVAKRPALEAIARATGFPAAALEALSDPTMRFAAAAEKEAQQPAEHLPEDRAKADDEGDALPG